MTHVTPHLASLVARDVSKSYGPHVVLQRVSFTVAPGDRVGVVAPNGTGKSTLLRILAGLEAPDSGSVACIPPNATVGYLPQEPERRADETLRRFLARRTGVAGAEAMLETSAHALASGAAGSDDTYAHALDRFLALGGPDFDARLGVVCEELDLPERLLASTTATLSGGEAARASLAAILLSRYDVFLLDEPTNDLDFAGLDRLEQFVTRLPGAAVIVSHDRAFLDRTITAVLELDDHEHTAREFNGGWRAYLEERAIARRHAEEEYADYTTKRTALNQRAQREREWSVQGVSKVKKSSENDKHIRAFRRNSSEHVAAKARLTERAAERLEVVDKPWEGWELRMEIASAPRSGSVVARLDGAVVALGDFVLGPVDLEIGWAERVAILGPNGSGKTTLLRALLGDLPLEAGERRLGPGVVVGTLEQARARFLTGATLLDGFRTASGLQNAESRSLLAKFGLGADHVGRAPATLSPGERTRAELALLSATGVNCLVLDEPTNHLDLPAIEQLEQALAAFEGTLLLVTHDRGLIDALHFTRTIEILDGRIAADRAAQNTSYSRGRTRTDLRRRIRRARAARTLIGVDADAPAGPARHRLWPEWRADAAIALVVVVLQVFFTGVAAHHQHARLGFTVPAVLLLALGPVALLVRRRYPVAVLAIVFVSTLAYWSAGFPKGPIFFALIVAFVWVDFIGYRTVAIATVVAGWAAFSWLPWLLGREDAGPGIGGIVGLAAWLLVLLSGAEIARARRERAVDQARTREEAARRRASEERVRIAQDLHDVLAHNISLINVQAGVALHLGDELPEPARAAFRAIKTASRDALGELRSVLDILRDPEHDLPRAPVPGLADVEALVARVSATGVPVESEVIGAPRPLPASVDVAAYRIVQEALTNVVRHAGSAHACVRVEYLVDAIRIEVLDDGVSVRTNGDHGEGKGIAGMHERAVAVGGRLSAGSRPGGGFRVRAELPAGPPAGLPVGDP